MGQYGDWFIMIIAGALLAAWLYRAFYRWLHEPASMNRVKIGKGGALDSNDANIKLLEQAGYRVISGKHVLVVPLELDGEPLGNGTRLYIDYIAEMDGNSYVVKTARERKPMEWTASGIRDRLLIYALLLPDTDGILFIDTKEGTIRQVIFHITE